MIVGIRNLSRSSFGSKGADSNNSGDAPEAEEDNEELNENDYQEAFGTSVVHESMKTMPVYHEPATTPAPTSTQSPNGGSGAATGAVMGVIKRKKPRERSLPNPIALSTIDEELNSAPQIDTSSPRESTTGRKHTDANMEGVITRALDISHTRLQHSLIQMKEDMMKQLLAAVNVHSLPNSNSSIADSKPANNSIPIVPSNNVEELKDQIRSHLDNVKLTTLLQIVSIINNN